MKITFIGHSALYIETENVYALIDPFITGNPQSTLTADEITKLTHIFITHGHVDHIGDAVELAKKHGALVITNFEIANHLAQQGINVHPLHIGGRKTFDFGVVKMTAAVHGSAIPTPEGTVDGGNPGGFLLSIDGINVYHAGDTGLTMDMQLLKQEAVDIAFLPIGGNFTMDVEDAVRATEMIGAKLVVPIHYNTFGLISADPEAFKSQVKASRVLVMAPGSSIEL